MLKKMMSIEKNFYDKVMDWENYCESVRHNSSDSTVADYLGCKEYRDLINMGKEILPFIKKIYKIRINRNSIILEQGFPYLIKEICKEKYEISEEILGKKRTLKNS